MPSGREKEQVNRAVNALRDADNSVWSNPSFPRAHRPDVEFLVGSIKIADQPSQYHYHPGMRPEILQDVARRNKRIRDRINSVFWYDSETREVVISKRAFTLDDRTFRRFSWNHAARDIVSRREVIEPGQYPDDLVEQIGDLLKLAFHIKNRPSLEDTRVVKAGYRKSLFAGSYLVTGIDYLDMRFIDEVYPATLEIITDEMLKRGSIFSFDLEVQSGLVTSTGRAMENFWFAKNLFTMMQIIDWRDILTAFRTGDVEQTTEILEQKAKKPNMGARIYLELVEAMKRDEIGMMNINAVLAGTPRFRFSQN